MVDSWIRTRLLRLPNYGDTRHLCCTRYQLCRLELCASWAASVKGKKAPTTELNIFLSNKKFRKKVINDNKTINSGWHDFQEELLRPEFISLVNRKFHAHNMDILNCWKRLFRPCGVNDFTLLKYVFRGYTTSTEMVSERCTFVTV